MTSSPSDKRKQSLYFPANILEDIQAEAVRLDRSLSWVVQQAWKIAQTDIAQFQSFGDKSKGGEAETV